jgi:hypothetical protein
MVGRKISWRGKCNRWRKIRRLILETSFCGLSIMFKFVIICGEKYT